MYQPRINLSFLNSYSSFQKPVLIDTRVQLRVFMHFIWCYATFFYFPSEVLLMFNLKIINIVTLLE